MRESILLGRGNDILPAPVEDWKRRLAEAPARIARRLDFMTRDHHRVRYFVVRELPRIGEPIKPEVISDALGLSPAGTRQLLEDMEKKLFFHVRDENGAVSWAFPVTVDETPHRLVFSTGERLYAA